LTDYNAVYSEDELMELYGEEFVLAVDGEELRYSDPSRPDENYEVALYYSPTFGCTPFPVFEVVFSVTEDAEVEELSQFKIGQIDSGYCVD